MGYTIYYSTPKKNITKKKVATFIKEARTLLEVFGVREIAPTEDIGVVVENLKEAAKGKLQGPEAVPIKEVCAFTIIKEGGFDALLVGGPCEWLTIPDFPDYSKDDKEMSTFTKTAWLAYDGLIKILYLVALKHLGGSVSHDGLAENYLKECLEDYSDANVRLLDHYIKEYLEGAQIEDSYIILKPKVKESANSGGSMRRG